VAWLPTLALCYMAVRTMGMTQAAPPERFVPTPKTATLVYTTERWSVWVHRELVKRTRQCIRPSQVFRYYLQAKPRDPATLVFITTSTEPHRVVGVLGDGTVALQWRCYDFAVVTREGEQLFRQPIDVDGDLAWVSAAYDNGVLLQEYDTSPTDVFFVPWSPPVLDMEKRVRVTTKEVDYHRCPYWRSGDTLAWSTRKDIRLFELKTRIERSLMYEADRRYSRQITVFDGKTITLEGVLYDVATGRTTASGP